MDSLPLHLLRRDPIPPRPFAELLLNNTELLRQFASWVFTFQPHVWEEIQRMATTTTKIQLDWQEIGKHVDLTEILRTLPPEQVIQKLMETGSAEKVLEELLARMPPERKQELIRRLQQQGE